MADQEGKTAMLAATEQRTIQLEEGGSEVTAVRVATGEIFVPVRPLCTALGVDALGQIQRIRRRQALAEMLKTITVPTSGGDQALVCIELEGLAPMARWGRRETRAA